MFWAAIVGACFGLLLALFGDRVRRLWYALRMSKALDPIAGGISIALAVGCFSVGAIVSGIFFIVVASLILLIPSTS